MESTIRQCPKCGNSFPSYPGYPDWCDVCNWNLNPPDRIIHKDTLYDKAVRRIGDKYSKALLEEMMSKKMSKPRMSWQALLTLLISVGNFLFWLLLIFGAVLLSTYYENPFAILGCIALSLLAVLLRPRIIKNESVVLSKSEAPTLHRVVQELQLLIESRNTMHIIVNQTFNASMGYSGLRRKRMLTLGYPLVRLLTAQELVELIAHELAHDVNGDPARSFFQWYTINSLILLHQVTYPDKILSGGEIFSVPFNLLMWLFSQGIAGLMYATRALSFHDSQRAEYYADYLGVTLAGSKASLSSFDKLFFDSTLNLVVQHAVLNNSNEGVIRSFERMIGIVPEREMDRRRRAEAIYSTRVDSSHPPTSYRQKFIQNLGEIKPGFVLTPEDHEQILLELSALEEQIDYKLIDDYRASIYS